MAARIVIRGRSTYATRDMRELERQQRLRRSGLPVGRKGTPQEGQLVGASAIPADSPQSPFRAGVALVCEEDNVVYRVVTKLDPRDGWATTGFWQKRWKCAHADVCKLVERGLIDAAIEHGSQVRRFRCRDERLVLKSDVMVTAERKRAVYRARFLGKKAR